MGLFRQAIKLGHRLKLFVISFLKYLFLRKRAQAGEEQSRVGRGVGDGQMIPNRLRAHSSEPSLGLQLTKCEIMTRAETGR